MRTVLVTGGNGFIGRYVVEALVARGIEVSVLDTRDREPVEGSHVVLGDIRDATSVTEAAAHADGIIHLAGVLGTQETIKNPRPAAETNILGGLNMLEAAAQYDIPMVNIAVGNWWMNNTYSISKNTVERFAAMFAKERKTRVSVVRALNAYGPRQSVAAPYGTSKVRKIMPSFICRALRGEAIEVYGDGTQIMDMIYVADVAEILVRALEFTERNGASPVTFEAGSGNDTTVNDIAVEVLSAVHGLTGIAPIPVRHLPMRPGEEPNSVVLGDPTTLSLLGDIKLRPLYYGVQDSVTYFQEYLKTR